MRHLTNPTGGILYKLFCCCCVRIYTLFTLAVFNTYFVVPLYLCNRVPIGSYGWTLVGYWLHTHFG